MTLNRWLTHLNRVKNPLFNGMIIIPTILTVTLALEVAAQEDFSPIAPITYAESEPASEDEDLDIYLTYLQSLQSPFIGLELNTPQNPYSNLNSSLKAGSEDDGSGDNVYYGTGIFGAGNTDGNEKNAALGYQALYSLTSGDNNIAMGYQSLYSNTTGRENTGVGYGVLYNTTTGDNNIAMGYRAMNSNTTGSGSVGIGYEALYTATTEGSLTAIGYQAAKANTTGTGTVAVGYQALTANTTGDYNTAVGDQALTVVSSLLLSLAVALFIIPGLAARLHQHKKSSTQQNALFSNTRRGFNLKGILKTNRPPWAWTLLTY